MTDLTWIVSALFGIAGLGWMIMPILQDHGLAQNMQATQTGALFYIAAGVWGIIGVLESRKGGAK